MSIRIRSRSLGTLLGGDLAVDIHHSEDSVTLGDETSKLQFLDEGGVKSLPVVVLDTPGAQDATLTGGNQRTQITDGTDNAEIDDVGGEKALKVSVISSIGGAAAPAHSDNNTFTPDSGFFTPIGGVRQDSPSNVTDGRAGALRMTSDRKLMVDATLDTTGLALETKQDAAIIELVAIKDALANLALESTLDAINTKLGGTLAVSGTFWQATQPVSATSLPLPTGAATQTTLADILSKLNASLAVTGDFYPATQPVSGTFWQSTQPVSLASVPTHAVTQSGSWNVGLNGGLVNPHGTRSETTHNNVTLTGTTQTTLISAGGSGVFTDLMLIMVTNEDDTNAARLDFRDSTSGTIRFSIAVAPSGGAVVPFPVPVNQATANNNWTVQMSTASVSSMRVFALGVQRTG